MTKMIVGEELYFDDLARTAPVIGTNFTGINLLDLSPDSIFFNKDEFLVVISQWHNHTTT